MTREEAIEELSILLNKYQDGRFGDAIDMAMTALEQEPCNDTISRETVHDLLATWLSDKLDEKTREVLEVIDGKVEDMPSVTPKQRTGHWKSTIDEKSHHWVVRCDKCGWIQETTTNYCPDCGKRMVEPQENCDTCKHKDDEWDSEYCDGCCGNHSGFESQESETDMSEEISREEIAALLARESEEQA